MEPDQLAGTIQNDIFKEYQAQKEYIYPPRPSVRIVTDMIQYTKTDMPRFHPVSISGYHIREAGSTAAQELAFTLANGFAYVEAAVAAGRRCRRVRRSTQLLLQQPQRLLRGDRQVPSSATYLGKVDEGTLRGHPRTVDVVSVPYADGGCVADCTTAGDQHRPCGHSGARRGARRNAESPHRQLR